SCPASRLRGPCSTLPARASTGSARLAIRFVLVIALLAAIARDAEQHAHPGHHRNERRAAVAEERQWDAGHRDGAGDAAQVDQRLVSDPADDADAEQDAELVSRLQRRPQAAIDEEDEETEHQKCADKPQLLRDDGEDAVRVGARDVEELLAAGAPAQPSDAAA